MASFLAWWSHHSPTGSVVGAKRRPTRWWYAAGDERLVLDVEERYRYRFFTRPGVTTGATATVLPGKGLTWPALAHHLSTTGLTRTSKLVVIRGGEGVSEGVWQRLNQWAREVGQHDHSRYLLVTGAERFRTRDDTDPRVWLFAHKRYGLHVDCNPLETAEQLRRYVLGWCSWLGGETGKAIDEFLVRCGWDLSRCRSEARKLRTVFGRVPIGLAQVQAVVVPSPGERLVELLLDGKKAQALHAVPQVPSVRYVIGSLDYTLHALYLIRLATQALRKRANIRSIAEYTGLPPLVVLRRRAQARTYDAQTVRRRYAALVRASRQADIAPEAALSALVLRW